MRSGEAVDGTNTIVTSLRVPQDLYTSTFTMFTELSPTECLTGIDQSRGDRISATNFERNRQDFAYGRTLDLLNKVILTNHSQQRLPSHVYYVPRLRDQRETGKS